MSSPQLSLEEEEEAAAEILAKRRLIRTSFAEWARYKGFEPAAHHQLIIDEIEAFLESDTLDVLLLHAPPGSAKSTYLSVLLPAWYLARNPTKKILAATHSNEFAMRWGRRVRGIVRDDAPRLGIKLDGQNAAADRWALASGGEYYGVGAGVGISGFRADLGVADDLFGNREDAWSETVRQKRWDWYLDDFSMRLNPGAKRILMSTRWHEEDTNGRVAEQIHSGQVKGRIIDIRAIAEDDDILGRASGAYLWDDPSGYDYASYLRKRKAEVSPMMWAALFQQRPAPETGDFFKSEWLLPYRQGQQPKRSALKVFGSSDYAMTADGGDWTVHLIGGVDEEDRLWLLDLWRDRTKPERWVEAFCDLVIEHKPIGWAEENVQITSGIGPYLDSRQRVRKAWVAREQFPTRGDKAFRAQSIRGRMALNGIHVPVDAEWFAPFKAELMSFPAGKHDDQVDALGLFGQLLDLMLPPKPPEKPKAKPKRLDWFETADTDDMNWKTI